MDFRELLYPLGFFASLAFGGRFLLQWLSSEYQKKSVVPKAFWILSLIGNSTLLLHGFIQLQYHLCFIQTCNLVISWRNLNLMGPEEKKVGFRFVLFLLLSSIAVLTVAFFFQVQLLAPHNQSWFRIPIHALSLPGTTGEAPLLLHLYGFLGMGLFASRFWVQWIFAEKEQRSYLGKAFWWLSLIGDFMTLSYFYSIGDTVNLIGPLLGTVPYIRNLMLMIKEERLAHETCQ